MQGEGRFTWEKMGKPDYSQCAAMVYSLPPGIRSKLSAPSLEVLCRITYLCWTFATRSGRGKAYCVPSERWLAEQVQRSERSIRRYLTVLSKYGLVSWTHRRGQGNTWTSNLYELGKTFLASLYASAGKKLQQNHQRTFLADNDLKKGIEGVTPTDAPSISLSSREKLEKLLATFSPSGAKVAAQEGKKQEEQWNSRKEMLKAQAEMLKRNGL